MFNLKSFSTIITLKLTSMLHPPLSSPVGQYRLPCAGFSAHMVKGPEYLAVMSAKDGWGVEASEIQYG